MEVRPEDGSHLLFDQSPLIKDRDTLNRKHAEKAINATNGLFINIYRSLADFDNYTSNNISTFMRFYAISDFNQLRLVKQKMATIFRADFHRPLTSYSADSFQGIFGGEDQVMRTLEETKKAENTHQEQSADHQESWEGG